MLSNACAWPAPTPCVVPPTPGMPHQAPSPTAGLSLPLGSGVGCAWGHFWGQTSAGKRRCRLKTGSVCCPRGRGRDAVPWAGTPSAPGPRHCPHGLSHPHSTPLIPMGGCLISPRGPAAPALTREPGVGTSPCPLIPGGGHLGTGIVCVSSPPVCWGSIGAGVGTVEGGHSPCHTEVASRVPALTPAAA